MKRGFGNVGYWCSQTCRKCGNLSLCEHNLLDASVRPMNVCTGIGGDCNSGEKFNCSSDACLPISALETKEEV